MISQSIFGLNYRDFQGSESKKRWEGSTAGKVVLYLLTSSKYLTILRRTFAKLKYTVIWKWDGEEMTGLPSNLLAHLKLAVFVNHGGLLSLKVGLFVLSNLHEGRADFYRRVFALCLVGIFKGERPIENSSHNHSLVFCCVKLCGCLCGRERKTD